MAKPVDLVLSVLIVSMQVCQAHFPAKCKVLNAPEYLQADRCLTVRAGKPYYSLTIRGLNLITVGYCRIHDVK